MLLKARDVMTRMPSADAIRNTNRPRVLSQTKSTQDDVFKVPSVPDLKGKCKAPDIAKELEKANKAVSPARDFFPSSPTDPDLATPRWLSGLQVIVLLSTGSTRLMQTLKKSGVSFIVVLNLPWCVRLFLFHPRTELKYYL